MYSITPRKAKKRGKYGRPCDRCAVRRIRCVISQDSKNCIGCVSLGEECTRDRIRKKSGPKHGRRLAAQSTSDFCSQSFSQGSQIDNISEYHLDDPLVDQAHYFELKKKPKDGQNPSNLTQSFAMSPSGENISESIDTRSLGFDLNTIGPGQASESQIPKLAHLGPLLSQQTMRVTHSMNQIHSVPLLYPSNFNQSAQGPASIFSHHQTNQKMLHHQDLTHIAPASPQIQGEPHTEHSRNINLQSSDYHEDILATFKTNTSPYFARITLDCLFSQMHIYQTWFYGYWPVLSVTDILQKLHSGIEQSDPYNSINLNEKNAMPYALCCAVCAAITTQLSFVSSEKCVMNQSPVSDLIFAAEAKRVRGLFNYTDNLEVETLLSSFFLYVHHTNQKGKNQQAKVYLREAITMSQILGFHEESSYRGKSSTEAHHWRKIYYMLLVTERYVSFEEGLPVILGQSIRFPVLGDENYPELLIGFSELIQIFAVPSKEFFFEMNQNRPDDNSIVRSIDEKKEWILAVQVRLEELKQISHNVTHPHKLNIVLSKAWIRAIACHITWNNGLLRPSVSANDYFGYDFPIKNAREFLMETSYLPDMAFEANGPGICVKLLEIAKSLSFTVQQSRHRLAGLAILESLFDLVNKFKNDVSLPLKVYQGVASLIVRHKLKVVPRLLDTKEGGFISQGLSAGSIEELVENKAPHSVDVISKEEYASQEFSSFSKDLQNPDIQLSASVSNFLSISYPHTGNAIADDG